MSEYGECFGGGQRSSEGERDKEKRKTVREKKDRGREGEREIKNR